MKIIFMVLVIVYSLFGNSLPKGYYTYRDTLYAEVNTIFPEFYVPPYFGALIDHESCITSTHSKCWNPLSRLKTSREEGAGLGQVTRAYNKDGSIRFDTLSDLVRQYPVQLKGLSWNTVYTRADLQIRAMILLWKYNYKMLNNKGLDYYNLIAFSDAAYNGGYNGVYKDMQLCKFKANCDPRVWFDNVEKTCSKGKTILYGNRSACDINRDHVKLVMKKHLDPYVIDWTNQNYIDKYKIKIE